MAPNELVVTIDPEGLCCSWVILNYSEVAKARLFEPEGLSPGSGTDFD